MSCDPTAFDDPTLSPHDRESIARLADHFSDIIRLIGDDPSRPGLEKTPLRAAKALWFCTQGYRQEPAQVLRQAIFDYAGSQMVVVRDIEFYSYCEHHILPFFGTVSIGYIPDGSMVGLSKLPRLVNAIARRLQVQERLTAEICAEVTREVSHRGVIVVCRASHLCMQMRGVEKQQATTTTLDYSGLFASDPALRAEFLRLIAAE